MKFIVNNRIRLTILLNNNKYLKLLVKFLFLILAIVLMGFSQAILSFTSKIGMAPIDAFTKSLGILFSVTYQKMNYFIVLGLIIIALLFSKKDKIFITLTTFITGFSLAFIVSFLVDNVVQYFPGLMIIDKYSTTKSIWWGILWFFVGYFLLILSISIWVNVGYALRPYEAVQYRMGERITSLSQKELRTYWDIGFIIFSLFFSICATIFLDGKPFFKGDTPTLTIGLGTIFIMSTAGILINIFSQTFNFFK